MDRDAVLFLQLRLASAGLFDGPADGRRSRAFHDACERALAAAAVPLSPDWQTWSDKRKAVALVQIAAAEAGEHIGRTDGWWCHLTEHAFRALEHRARTGLPPYAWRDDEPGTLNPHGWPAERELAERLGPPLPSAGTAPPLPLVTVPCPWRLKLAWNQNLTRSGIRVHRLVADSLATVLARVEAEFGAAEIARLGLDLLGGDYEVRRKRGGTGWSTHAWGLAIDFDPMNNRLEWGRDRARFAGEAYRAWWRIWEAEGWVSLGRCRGFDWGHVQAARL
jgi:hypothetical protein